MKKDTLIQKINKMEMDVRKSAKYGPIIRQLAAIKNLRSYVERSWADMLDPVKAEMIKLREELTPYQEKINAEKRQFNTIASTYNLYVQFSNLVGPTVRNAQLQKADRARYKQS